MLWSRIHRCTLSYLNIMETAVTWGLKARGFNIEACADPASRNISILAVWLLHGVQPHVNAVQVHAGGSVLFDSVS